MTNRVKELTVSELRRVCLPEQFHFKSTAELPTLNEVVGQERAVRAVNFGIGIENPGYHMYALGPAGTGKTTTIRQFLERRSKDQAVPDDWCYVNNFSDKDKPHALHLPAGMGCKFEADMGRLVEDLKTDVPSAFESEDY
jgi:Cdc6-like AAA superfamily ATPase